MAAVVQQASEVHLALLEPLGQWGLPDLLVRLVSLAQLAAQAQVVLQGCLALRVQQAALDQQAKLVQLDLEELLEPLDHQVPRVLLVLKGQQEQLGQLVRPASLVPLDHQVSRDQLDIQA